ncbi:MAG: hypothetical protein RSB70_00180 [Clostridium sp.]
MNIKEEIISKFISNWNLCHCKGRKNFILRNGILKPITMFTIVYLLYSFIKYDNLINMILYENNVYVMYIISIFAVSLSGYIISYNFWDFNNKLYLKLNLKNIMEDRIDFQGLKHGEDTK